MNDFLLEVTAKTRQRIAASKSRVPASELKKHTRDLPPARSFTKALSRPGRISLIAELKQASPSAGVIRLETNMEGRIHSYGKGGASALSILTEENYFHGSPQLLELARRISPLPLLRKDFIIDSYQIDESRPMGADAILLIAALLPGHQLNEFLHHAREVGIEALVEIHDEEDLEHALRSEPPLIGVNNRNLRTLRVDVQTSRRLVPLIPRSGRTIVVESGIKDASELPTLKEWGANAVLIGETLMRHSDPEAIVRSFVNAGMPVGESR